MYSEFSGLSIRAFLVQLLKLDLNQVRHMDPLFSSKLTLRQGARGTSIIDEQ